MHFWQQRTAVERSNKDTVQEFWGERVLEALEADVSKEAPLLFARAIETFFEGQATACLCRSGREGLRALLAYLRVPNKPVVLLGDFNCPAVADAVQAAGFQIETFDVADHTGRIDWEMVANRLGARHAAVLVPHLFGVPSDFTPILAKASQCGAYVIEDCAHTLGGRILGRLAGTIGDAAILSFNYDKPISLGGGGAVLLRKGGPLERFRADRQDIGAVEEMYELRRFQDYLRSRRRQIRTGGQPPLLQRMVHIWRRVVSNRSSTYIPATAIGPLRSSLGVWQIERYPEIVRVRNRNTEIVRNLPGCVDWHVGPGIDAAWLKAKVVPRTPESANASCLCRRGLRVGGFNWPDTIEHYLGGECQGNAGYLSRYALDVPIHQEMTADELNLIAGMLQR
jgi:dTDP-4-amino-4,6-dideoxygalactose transaminase